LSFKKKESFNYFQKVISQKHFELKQHGNKQVVDS